MNYKVWLSILLSISLLNGCSFSLGERKSTSAKVEEDTLGLTPDFSYEVREQLPGILVNQLGYLSKSFKTAILQAKEPEMFFQVFRADTKEKVYTGYLESVSLEQGEERQMYIADFSALEQPGTYYLYQSDLGYSYPFQIGEHLYEDVEKELLSLLEIQEQDTSLICYQLAGLLLTRELYPDNLLEQERFENLCQEKIRLLLQAQDEITGNVYANVSSAERIQHLDETQKQPYVSLAATAEFAGTLANYAYGLQEEDKELAREYQAAAEKAYQGIQNSLDNVSFDAGYYAAAHLYRLTGKAKYAGAVGQYLKMKEEQRSYTEYDFSLFADYAYLTLCYGSNLEWSEQIMKKIMEQAEMISLSAGKNTYYVSEKRDYNDIDGILCDMSEMALVNYIIPNHEYSTLQKNYLDYLLGRNLYNVCFLDGFGTKNAEREEEKIDGANSSLCYLLLQSAKGERSE